MSHLHINILAIISNYLSVPIICLILITVGFIHRMITKNTYLFRGSLIASVCLLFFLYIIPRMIDNFRS